MLHIQTTIDAPLAEVWQKYNSPEHIVNWNFAHESWSCPKAENNLQVGGKLSTRMEAKDGSFDFVAIYDEIEAFKLIKYHLEDGRNVEINFTELSPNSTQMDINFDPESENPIEMQQEGWQAILNNFKSYVEG